MIKGYSAIVMYSFEANAESQDEAIKKITKRAKKYEELMGEFDPVSLLSIKIDFTENNDTPIENKKIK